MEILGLQYDLERLMWALGLFELVVVSAGALLWALTILHVLLECTGKPSEPAHSAEQLKSA